jgi:hypothetical protein
MENKKKIIVGMVIDMFDRISTAPIPSNFDEIVEFIYNDVNETADPINWDVNDVHFSFYKWIETK